jgi:hypothetical protein
MVAGAASLVVNLAGRTGRLASAADIAAEHLAEVFQGIALAGILNSQVVECVGFYWKRFLAPARIQYLLSMTSNKKPPATASQGV